MEKESVEKLVEVFGLKVAAEGREILHGVDFEILPGEIVVLTGANGAGKSTLAKAVAGIFSEEEARILSGRILLRGEEITGMTADERARRGMFYGWQMPAEVAGITETEMLQTALIERGEKVRRAEVEERIAAAARELKMDMFMAGREVNVGWSGGERKKGEILQMMVLNPAVAILDEPDSGVDRENARIMSRAIGRWQEKTGAGMMIISHNEWILEELSVSRWYEMREGRIERSF